MRLEYIQHYPLEEGIQRYIEDKLWKIGGKKLNRRPPKIEEYLIQKMQAFIAACPAEKQMEAKKIVEAKIGEAGSRPLRLPIKLFKKRELAQRLTQRLATCYPGYSCERQYSNIYEHLLWKQSERSIEAFFKVSKTKGNAPIVEINLFSANCHNKDKNKAICFILPIVQELQRLGDPHAVIELDAANAYVWSMLGFQTYEYSKKQRAKLAFDKEPGIKRIQDSLESSLRDAQAMLEFFAEYAHKVKKDFNGKIFLQNFNRISAESITLLNQAKQPWEISEIIVQGFPIGRYLMGQSHAKYKAVLFPNLPHSAGMKQFAKRMALCASSLTTQKVM
jgi:hypothetical protein